MRTHLIPALRGWFPVFILPLTLLMVPDRTLAQGDQSIAQVAEASQAEGSKSKGSGSPHGMKGSPQGMRGGQHGKSEGSGSKHGYGKGYGHGSKHGYGKKEGSHGRGYGGHGYRGGHRGGHGGHGKDPFRHVLKFAGALGLTEAQISKIKNIKFEFAKERIMLKAQHRIAHMELDQLVHSGEVKESKMRAIADRIAEIKSKKIHSMVDAKIDLLQLMTPEQRKKISKLHSKH